MKFTHTKLADLQKKLREVTAEVAAGKLDHQTAAEKIVLLREEMDKIIAHLKDKVGK